MQGMWIDDVLALPNCGAQLGDNAQVLACARAFVHDVDTSSGLSCCGPLMPCRKPFPG